MRFSAKVIPAIIALSIVLTGSANAGLLLTDGAEPVEAKHVEVELNVSYIADNHRSIGVTTKTDSTDGDMTVTVGIAKALDASVVVPYTFAGNVKVNGVKSSRTEGFNDITVAIKYQFLETDGLKLAIKPGLILPTGKASEGLSDGKLGYTAALLATGEFNEGKFVLHANAGYERHNYKDKAVKEEARHDIFAVSIACEAEIAEGLKLAADTGLATNADRASDTPPAYALVGAKYEFSKMLEGYAGVKFGLTNPEDDVSALFGTVLKF